MTKDETLKMRVEQDEQWEKVINREWQGLTDDKINEIVRNVSDDMYPWKGNMLIGKIIRAIEQELKIKNGFSGLKDKNT
jgi:hypothetical protein